MRPMSPLLKAAALAVLAAPSTALAVFDVEIGAGKRWYTIEGEEFDDGTSVSAQEIIVGAHVDPIPAVPLGLGISYAVQSHNERDWSKEQDVAVDVARGSELAANAKIWLPILPAFTPYVKYRYVLQGRMQVEGTIPLDEGEEGYDVIYETRGNHLHFGVRTELAPLVSLAIEGASGRQQLRTSHVDGVSVTDAPWQTLQSKAFLVGIEVGM